MPKHADHERDALTGRWEKASREADNAWMRVRGAQAALDILRAAAAHHGQQLPPWALHALDSAEHLAKDEYKNANAQVDEAWEALNARDRLYSATAPAVAAAGAAWAAGTVTR